MARRRHDRQDLERIADRAMRERGFEPDFPREVTAEVARLQAAASDAAVRDLRQLSWCSIDNDDSMDLDQLSVAEPPKNGLTRIWVAIADVAELVITDEGALTGAEVYRATGFASNRPSFSAAFHAGRDAVKRPHVTRAICACARGRSSRAPRVARA